MAVLNPNHLFEQAEKLAALPLAGPPRQVDLRRAISNTYYGVFHHIATAAADEFIGRTKRTTRSYTLAYRSVDHRRLRDICKEVSKSKLVAKLERYAPESGFGLNIQSFAHSFVELQERRHSADYDPSISIRMSDVRLALVTARSAIRRYEEADAASRAAFLALLIFALR